MAPTETAEVLITVKASPEPSEKYGDTVCVAGIRIDGAVPEWIRLYPVPFRYLHSESQFNKYDVIGVDLHRPSHDLRSESYRLDLESITRLRRISSKQARGALLEKMVGPTMCELRAGVVANLNGQSLGLVRPRKVKRIVVSKHPGWTDAQKRKVAQRADQVDLFGTEPPPALQQPRFAVRYEYWCESVDCKLHSQSLLDWELTALQLNLSKDSDAVAMKKIEQKFFDEMCSPTRRPHFFVGNFADPVKRKNFSVLGVYSPAATSDYAATLDIGFGG